MRILVAIALVLFVSGCSARMAFRESVVGLWQFPFRGAWVEIRHDGSAFQCRVAEDGEVIYSRGHLSGRTIFWEQGWRSDRLTLSAAVLTLDGEHGKFEFLRAADAMSDSCRAAKG